MGQISLPRLEKINTSMHWESGLCLKQESWAAPKLFLLHKMITHYWFKYTFLKKRKLWIKKHPKFFNKTNFFFLRTSSHVRVSINKKKGTLNFINSYIYQWDNCYYSLVVYANSKSSLKFKYKR